MLFVDIVVTIVNSRQWVRSTSTKSNVKKLSFRLLLTERIDIGFRSSQDETLVVNYTFRLFDSAQLRSLPKF